MVASRNTFITNATMFRAKRLSSHALYAKCLAIEPSFRRELFNDLEAHQTIDIQKVRMEMLTDLSSSSLVGLGHVPGSRVIERKKLYEQRPTVRAKRRWLMACDWVWWTSRVAQQKTTQTMDPVMIPAKYGVWLTLSVYVDLLSNTRVTIYAQWSGRQHRVSRDAYMVHSKKFRHCEQNASIPR